MHQFKVGQVWETRHQRHASVDAIYPDAVRVRDTITGHGYTTTALGLRSEGCSTDDWDLVRLVSSDDDFDNARNHARHPYHALATTLVNAFNQAASGKGKERHGSDGVKFEDQPMSTINKALYSIDGFVYQAHKKSLESKRLPDGRAQAELLGAINYLAGAVIALDTWAKKD